jgi:hypothetical protein
VAYQYKPERQEDNRHVLLFVPHWRTQRRLEVDDLSQLTEEHYPAAPCPLYWSAIEEWSASLGSPEGFSPIHVMQKAARAFLDHPLRRWVAVAADLFLSRLGQLPTPKPEPKQRYEVYGVPIRGWGDPDVFRRATGITFPIVGPPGLAVDTDRHPVTVLHNKQTHVTRVVAVGEVSYGEVSYAEIVEQTTSFTKGEATTRVRGAA